MIVAGIYVEGGSTGQEWRLAKAVMLSEDIETERLAAAEVYERATLVVEPADGWMLPGMFVGSFRDLLTDPRVANLTYFTKGA